MKSNSLKDRTAHGFVWNAIEKLGVRFVQFCFGIVLARILNPSDFGLVGMLTVFIAISQAFIDTGMASGLIQKQNRTDADYSTVFVFNLLVSIAFYIILFVVAPFIATFYNEPELTLLLRILALNLVISALTIVQRARLTITLDFKKHAAVNLVSALAGGITGVVMAAGSMGVWSLAGQTLAASVAGVAMLWFIGKGAPVFAFSVESFRQLFAYGSKLLAASVYARIMQEVYNIIIGKSYSAAELGIYTRARSFTQLAAETITTVINQVSFPVLSSIQDNRQRLMHVTRQLVRMAAFLIIPTMLLIFVLAEPLVLLLLTEKWRPVIPLLQWLVLSRVFYPMSAINLNLLKAVGRSDWFLKVDMSKFPLLIVSLVITVPLGLKAVVIGQVVVGFLAYLINTIIPGRYFGYGAVRQLSDMMPTVCASLAAALCAWLVSVQVSPLWFKLLAGGTTGLIVFLTVARMLRIAELQELLAVTGRYVRYKNS